MTQTLKMQLLPAPVVIEAPGENVKMKESGNKLSHFAYNYSLDKIHV